MSAIRTSADAHQVPDDITSPTGAWTTAPDALRFDRRVDSRVQLVGTLEAMRADLFARPVKVELQLVDESSDGIGAETSTPLPPGSRLCVCTSPGADVWRSGVVVRCVPNGHGYRIGLAYERRQAA